MPPRRFPRGANMQGITSLDSLGDVSDPPGPGGSDWAAL